MTRLFTDGASLSEPNSIGHCVEGENVASVQSTCQASKSHGEV